MSNPRQISKSIEIVNPNAKPRNKVKNEQVKTYSEFESMLGSPNERYSPLSASLPNMLLFGLSKEKKSEPPKRLNLTDLEEDVDYEKDVFTSCSL